MYNLQLSSRLMRPRYSLTIKLSYAFFGVSLVAILLMALAALSIIQSEFNQFLDEGGRDEIVTRLANYYQQNQSWDGVNSSGVEGAFTLEFGQVLAVVDAQNSAVYPLGDSQTLGIRDEEFVESSTFLENFGTTPIMVDGVEVGRLASETGGDAFFVSVRWALYFAVVGTAVISLILGNFFSRTLTKPLRELSMATLAVASGDLEQQVAVGSQDELGQLAQSFNQMTQDLATSLTARRQMTADIAHDLRTPLSIIRGNAEALVEGVLPATPESLQIIHEEALHLQRLIDDLRTLSLSETGVLSHTQAALDLDPFLERLLAAHQGHAAEKEIELRADLNASAITLFVDADRLTQVLDNLLNNAIRHTPAAGKIELTSDVADGSVSIAISDSGPGIPQADLQKIFGRLYRVDRARSRDAGGSGLGLAISKSLVDYYGGTIQAENLPQGGSRFTVVLPAH